MPAGPEYTHCKRCRRQAPVQASRDFLYWETDENGLPICPGCLTGLEEQAIAEGAMTTAETADRLAGLLPAPGLDGTYTGSCVVCLNGCDTALAFVGEAEWSVAGLTVLGIPSDQAQTMVIEQLATVYGITEPDTVPDGDVTVAVSVCESCRDRSGAGFPLGLTSTGDIPAISQS